MAYDSAATRQRILDAAATEFAAHGVAGARVDRIAAAARANKRAIYDYFGDKHALFAAVLHRQLSDVAAAVPIDTDLADYAQRLAVYHAEHPEALRLLLWEALELGDHEVPAEAARTAHYRHKVDAITSSGSFAGDPRALVFFTLGLVSWTFAVPQLRRMILGPNYPPERLNTALADAVHALAITPDRDIK